MSDKTDRLFDRAIVAVIAFVSMACAILPFLVMIS